MLQRYWLFIKKKLCYLLFPIGIAIGHLSSTWPGSSSYTVIVPRKCDSIQIVLSASVAAAEVAAQ